jgi:16S rRNA (adenine1518-N6/adenine1519-N6)-dimethyltransferase
MERRLTDLGYIKSLARRHNFKFDKKYGQNFITDPNVCPKIVKRRGVDKNCGVLEIGTGIGVLTKELCKSAAKVVSVEIDESLRKITDETLGGEENLKIIFADAMKIDLKKLIADEFGSLKVKVCANLPYYITSPIIMMLLEKNLPIESITVMVQKEVADRICAPPAGRDSGAVSLAVEYYCEREKCFFVPAGAFYPQPKVDSTVIKLTLREKKAVNPKNEKQMFNLIRGTFGQRRKTFLNSAAKTMNIPKAEVAEAMKNLNLDINIRPERMTLKNFRDISDLLF